MSTNAWNFFPLPVEAHQFKGIFYMTYYDEDGNQTATNAWSHAVELGMVHFIKSELLTFF
jgi:hypothetical protein